MAGGDALVKHLTMDWSVVIRMMDLDGMIGINWWCGAVVQGTFPAQSALAPRPFHRVPRYQPTTGAKLVNVERNDRLNGLTELEDKFLGSAISSSCQVSLSPTCDLASPAPPSTFG